MVQCLIKHENWICWQQCQSLPKPFLETLCVYSTLCWECDLRRTRIRGGRKLTIPIPCRIESFTNNLFDVVLLFSFPLTQKETINVYGQPSFFLTWFLHFSAYSSSCNAFDSALGNIQTMSCSLHNSYKIFVSWASTFSFWKIYVIQEILQSCFHLLHFHRGFQSPSHCQCILWFRCSIVLFALCNGYIILPIWIVTIFHALNEKIVFTWITMCRFNSVWN